MNGRRADFWVVLILLAGHGLLLAWLVQRGLALDLYQGMLVAVNVVLAWALFTLRVERGLCGAGMLLVAAHVVLGPRLSPDALTAGAMLLANLLALVVGWKAVLHLSLRHVLALMLGYGVLFWLFLLRLPNASPLFLLFLPGLLACSRSFRLLAYYWTLVAAFTLFQPHAWEALAFSWFILFALFESRAPVPSTSARVFLLVGFLLLALALLPLAVLALHTSFRDLAGALAGPEFQQALRLTFVTATVSTLLLLLAGVPLAYALARLRFPGRGLLLALVDLPIVIPQSAAGFALVLAFGRRQPLGEAIENVLGMPVDGTVLGILLAQVFVSLPFLVKGALAAFEAVPLRLELAARTLGAGSFGAFFRVGLPLALPGVLVSAVLAWARAAGEFGAVLILAPHPETAPVAVYNRFNAVGLEQAAPMVAALLFSSAVMFLLLQALISAVGRRRKTLPSELPAWKSR